MTAKRPNPDEQDEYDLLGYLGVDYKMEKAWSRDGDDPAGDGNDNKAGGDRSEDEENLDIRAIATGILRAGVIALTPKLM
ncbi:hypothetical protein PF002_g736 [Phytophthora fragariae]|uniref:Uncharacterized protein n=1 Tax=Phytophthora fragariae TaxID=53985 RepID=A0A6A3UUQ6_9STRA|nr:hypothetical protein PF006_g421 [Phytophthora fragariae]KAE9257763.1 hypothetical protein PF002_g736 [Phytophthora fragariae]